MKIFAVSFPDERLDETWEVGDQASLASLLRGGSLAPATAPSTRVTSLKVMDSGAYSFVPPDAALDVPMLHNVTLMRALLYDGASGPLTFDKISASHLDEQLKQTEAAGLAETEEDARAGRHVKREFADLRSNATYWVVPQGETLRSQVRVCAVFLFLLRLIQRFDSFFTGFGWSARPGRPQRQPRCGAGA